MRLRMWSVKNKRGRYKMEKRKVKNGNVYIIEAHLQKFDNQLPYFSDESQRFQSWDEALT